MQDDKASSKSIPAHDSIPASQEACPLANAAAGPDSVRELTDLAGRLSLGEGRELRYFDSRSNLGMVDEQIDERCHYHLLKFPADRRQRPGIGDVEICQADREALLSVFWTWQNSWQYLVHEGAWNRSYTARDNEYCTPVLLYAMLAVAARYPNRSDGYGTYDPSTAGTSFSSKAKQLIFEEIEAPRVPTVIAAALISVAELSLDCEPAGWTYIGKSILRGRSYLALIGARHCREDGLYTRPSHRPSSVGRIRTHHSRRGGNQINRLVGLLHD